MEQGPKMSKTAEESLAEATQLQMPEMSQQGMEMMQHDLANILPEERLFNGLKPNEKPEEYKKRLEFIKELWTSLVHFKRFSKKQKPEATQLKGLLNTMELEGSEKTPEFSSQGYEMMRRVLADISPQEKLFKIEITDKTPEHYKELIKDLWMRVEHAKRFSKKRKGDQTQLNGILIALRGKSEM